MTGRAASRTWVTGCKGGSATDGPAKMSPMETRSAGAARAVGQGRKWGEEGRKATRKTVLSAFSGKVPGWGKVQSASGGRGEEQKGEDRQGLRGRRNRKIKGKKITSEGRKNLEWKLVDIQYLGFVDLIRLM